MENLSVQTENFYVYTENFSIEFFPHAEDVFKVGSINYVGLIFDFMWVDFC